MMNDNEQPEPRVLRSWPLVQLDTSGRPMWAVLGQPGAYAYDARLEALWRRAQRWRQRELWEVAA